MTAAVATIKGGFWETNGVAALSSMQGVGPWRRTVAQAFGKKGLLGSRELFRVLTGAVAGTNATKTYSRIQASTELGGKRVVETETLVNRVTAAGDVTEFRHDFLAMAANTFTASPVANGDHNPLGTR